MNEYRDEAEQFDEFKRDVKRGVKKIHHCGLKASQYLDEKANKVIPLWMQGAANSRAGKAVQRVLRGGAVIGATALMTKGAMMTDTGTQEAISLGAAAIVYAGAATALTSFYHGWREVRHTGMGTKFRAALGAGKDVLKERISIAMQQRRAGR